MTAENIVDILGLLFLGAGLWDGYRKGLVKKGMSLVAMAVTLAVVYMASPYVESFLRGILPQALSIENLTGTDSEIYRVLVLSGFGDLAESYVQSFAARVLSLIVTYLVVRIFLRTLAFSLELVAKVPGLSLLNRLLGAALGLFQQLLTVWIFFLLILIFSSTDWGGALCAIVRQSAFMSLVYENNLLLLIGVVLILGL